jgi:hypothetical protein
MAEWHINNPRRGKMPKRVEEIVLSVDVDDEDSKAVAALIRKHKATGEVADWLEPYRAELNGVIKKRCREIFGEEYKQVLKHKKVVGLRMNLEPKKDGRRKCRLIVKGFLEPKEWSGATDSPTVMASTIKMLVAMGIDTEDMYIETEDDDVISIGDISQAFLVADGYGSEDQERYVKYQAYKGGPVRVFQLTGPLYGQRDAGYKWYETLTAYLSDKENGFIQSDTDKCLFYNPTTRLRAAVHVDDVFLRGSRHQTRIFWNKMEDKFPLKHWEIVEEGQPLIYTGIEIGKRLYDGVVHYTMSMEHDIRVFLEDVGMAQVREVTAPMPTKVEILSEDKGVSEQEHVEYRAKVGSLSWFVGIRGIQTGSVPSSTD